MVEGQPKESRFQIFKILGVVNYFHCSAPKVERLKKAGTATITTFDEAENTALKASLSVVQLILTS